MAHFLNDIVLHHQLDDVTGGEFSRLVEQFFDDNPDCTSETPVFIGCSFQRDGSTNVFDTWEINLTFKVKDFDEE